MVLSKPMESSTISLLGEEVPLALRDPCSASKVLETSPVSGAEGPGTADEVSAKISVCN